MARIAVVTITAPNVGKFQKGARITLPEDDPAVARWEADRRCTVTMINAPDKGGPSVAVGHRAAMAAAAVEGHLDAAVAVRAKLRPEDVAGYLARVRAKHIAAKIAELVCTPGLALPETPPPPGLVDRLAALLDCDADGESVIVAVELALQPPDVFPGDDVDAAAPPPPEDGWAQLRAELDLAPDATPAEIVAVVSELLDERDGRAPPSPETEIPTGAALARLILGEAMKAPANFTMPGLIALAGSAGIALPNGADKFRKEQIIALIEAALAASASAPADPT